MNIDHWYIENLVCPRDHSALVLENNNLYCQCCKRSYPVVEGVPVMLLDDKEQTMELVCNSIKYSKGESLDPRAPNLYLESVGVSEEEKLLAISLVNKTKIDPVVNVIIGATSGYLYKKLIGRLKDYPIPQLRLENGKGKRLLDIGCNWGRWSIAAHKLNYQVVGIDPSLGAIMAARRASNSLGFDIKYVVADARFLPFGSNYFDVIFSYSVLQHLNRPNVELCLKEIYRSLKVEGYSVIQMANKFGIRSFYNQLRRRFKKPINFEVRYWGPSELKTVFNRFVGKTFLEADCYFGLGIQKSDFALVPHIYKMVIIMSELLWNVSKIFSPIINLADSLYVCSKKLSSSC